MAGTMAVRTDVLVVIVPDAGHVGLQVGAVARSKLGKDGPHVPGGLASDLSTSGARRLRTLLSGRLVMVLATLSMWMVLMPSLRFMLSTIPWGVRGRMLAANFVTSVSFIGLSGLAVMSVWFGCSGWAVFRRNCFESIWECSQTGMDFVSEWRWLMSVIFVQPIMTLRAFCAVCRSVQLVLHLSCSHCLHPVQSTDMHRPRFCLQTEH